MTTTSSSTTEKKDKHFMDIFNDVHGRKCQRKKNHSEKHEKYDDKKRYYRFMFYTFHCRKMTSKLKINLNVKKMGFG